MINFGLSSSPAGTRSDPSQTEVVMRTQYTGTLRVLNAIVQSAGVVVGVGFGLCFGLGIAAVIAYVLGGIH
jgi:hypothetical protein